MAEAMTRHFVGADGRPTVAAVVLAGPGPLKTDLARCGRIDARLAGLVAAGGAPVDTGHGGRAGFRQAVRDTAARFANAELEADRGAVQRVLRELGRGAGLAAVGARDVLALLADDSSAGVVAELVASERSGLAVVGADGAAPRAVPHGQAPAGAPALADWVRAAGNRLGVPVRVVRGATDEGEQLRLGLGGAAAVLRYPYDLTFLDDDQDEPPDEIEFNDDDDEFSDAVGGADDLQ